MTSDPRLTIELNTLCGKLREGEITDTEALRLDEILRTSRSARRFYRTFMALASALESRATLQGWDDLEACDEHNLVLLSQLLEIEQQAEQLALPAKAEPVDAAGIDRPREDRLGWRDIAGASSYLLGRALKSRPAKYAYAYAALFLLAATLIFALVTSDGPGTRQNLAGTNEADPTSDVPTPVATLTATYNAAWAGPASAAPAQGDTLRPNRRLTLTGGFAEITTARGAVAILEAPATIELTDNNNAIRLLTGKLVGICETPTSKGFLVRTPHMDITDLGTRFGVVTDTSASVIHVFEGEVEATMAAATGVTTRAKLNAGQSARVATVDDAIASIEHHTTGFDRLLPRAIEQSGTGVGLAVGEVDPNWQLIAIEERLLDTPLELRVARIPNTNDPDSLLGSSQWINIRSVGGLAADESRQFTFRTRVWISQAELDKPRHLLMHYAADNQLTGIRVNGVDQPIDSELDAFHFPVRSTRISDHLVHGWNTIDLRVADYRPGNMSSGYVGINVAWHWTQPSRNQP